MITTYLRKKYKVFLKTKGKVCYNFNGVDIMPYVALYRKYRPKKFDDVIGQKVTVEILKNSIINNKISHAYLFNGPRGTGKTSVAKIFAKSVNCLNNKNGNACGTCELCKKIQENDVDIIEIDAASNNGVEEIREIRSKVKLLPAVAKYKVYIIDEVHMLSTGAFNALLKTLEEPPSHVIFILATTEIHKIPLTILSRCQRFDFNKVNSEEMFAKLKQICKLEKKDISDNILKLIVKLSDGGCRDAVNLLDQVLSLSSENITEDEIYDMQGITSEDKIIDFLNTILENDIVGGMKFLDSFVNSGKNLNGIVEQLLILLHNIAIANTVDNFFQGDSQKKYMAINVNLENIKILTNILIELENQMNKSTNQRNLFETYYIYMSSVINDCKTNVSNNFVNLVKNSKQTPKKELKECSSENGESVNTDFNLLKKIRINNILATANKEELIKINHDYERINDFIANKVYNNIAALLLSGKVVAASSEYLLFSFDDKSLVKVFLSNLEKIEKFLYEIYNNEYKVMSVDSNEWVNIKNEFIINKKNKVVYEILPELDVLQNQNKKNTKFESITNNIFGDEVETIN